MIIIRPSKRKYIIFPIDRFSNFYLPLYTCDRVRLNSVRKTSIIENIDKIMKIVESDRLVSNVSIALAWSHLHKAGYKNKLTITTKNEQRQ